MSPCPFSGVAPGLPAGCVVVLIEDSSHLLLITYLCLFKLQSAVSSSPDRCLTWVVRHQLHHCLSLGLISLICIVKSLVFVTLSIESPVKTEAGQTLTWSRWDCFLPLHHLCLSHKLNLFWKDYYQPRKSHLSFCPATTSQYLTHLDSWKFWITCQDLIPIVSSQKLTATEDYLSLVSPKGSSVLHNKLLFFFTYSLLLPGSGLSHSYGDCNRKVVQGCHDMWVLIDVTDFLGGWVPYTWI